MGLETNLKNSKTIVCTPGYIWGNCGEHAYTRRETGEGEKYRDRNMLQVSYAECGVTVAQSYLKQHMVSLHGLCAPQTRGVNEKGERHTTYMLSLPRILHSVRYPVPGFPAISHSAVRLQEHFMFRHFGHR